MLNSVMNTGLISNSYTQQRGQQRAARLKGSAGAAATERKGNATSAAAAQKCMGCDDTSPACGFAQVFDTDAEEGEESFRILLCKDCYNDYDQDFERLLVAKLRQNGQKGKVNRGK